MSIRKYTNPRAVDLSPGLQDVLRRNGMQAHISMTENGYRLTVLGHDSPVLEYDLNEKQVENLMNWGSTYANKTAYNTFTSIVKNDFYMPQHYVAASNAGGRVAMGLNGYRIGPGEYGYGRRGMPWYAPFHRGTRGWGGDFVGWAPRSGGWHLRRINDRVFHPNGGYVPERPDGRIKPGELKSGGYGFYYKGQQQQTSQDVLDNLAIDTKIKPLEAAPRPQGQAVPYSSEITADVYFSNDKFQNVLSSHGIVIDAQKKTLTVQSNLSKVDIQYTLTDEEVRKLTANKLSEASVADRLALINEVIGKDFSTPVTKEMLETKDLVNLDLKPEVRAEVEAPFIEQERKMEEERRMAEIRAEAKKEADRIRRDPNAINGMEIQAILGNRGWFQPVEHGREMVVGEIRVLQIPKFENAHLTNEQIWEYNKVNIPDFESLTEEQKEAARKASDRIADSMRENQGKYLMTAVINGKQVTHSISAKDYQKFLDLDDKHRLKMFDQIFKEVEIKSANGREMYKDDVYLARDGQTVIRQHEADIEHATANKVDGAMLAELNEKKGFYRERAHGREVEVRDISVEPTETGKYKMTAVINGQAISHEISQKDYDKFLAVDDYQRMKLFSKIFNEVDIKTRPGQGTNIGAAILAALVVTGEVVSDLAMGRPPGPGPRPEIYESKMGPVFHKPGVISPEDVAAAHFRSMEANAEYAPGQGMGRGI